jgi:hypothetical protein
MDTFFRSVAEAARWGRGERIEDNLLLKMGEIAMATASSGRSSDLSHRPDHSTLAPRRLHRRAARAACRPLHSS